MFGDKIKTLQRRSQSVLDSFRAARNEYIAVNKEIYEEISFLNEKISTIQAKVHDLDSMGQENHKYLTKLEEFLA